MYRSASVRSHDPQIPEAHVQTLPKYEFASAASPAFHQASYDDGLLLSAHAIAGNASAKPW
jgi:hypothetical protein